MSEQKNIACVISSYAYIEDHINYGALLQYYALEKALAKEKISSYWLRYCIKDTGVFKKNVKRIIKMILDRKGEKQVAYTLSEFKDFLNEYCNISTKKFYSEKELERDLPEADIYITGSDQVWGGTLKPNYLYFVPDDRRKYSYAASFGKSYISEKHQEVILPWLKRLDLVSVRETSGIEICKQMGIEAKQVLDPTLLLDANEYPVETLEQSPSVFCYFLNIESSQQSYWNQVEEWIQNNNLTLGVACTESTYRIFEKKYVQLVNPKLWLSRYYNAQYILTNTFHGTVFAIIFKKPFIVFEQDGKSGKQNERIYSLLNMFGLIDRIYNPAYSIKEQIQCFINWNDIDDVLVEYRKNSNEYIRSMIGNI